MEATSRPLDSSMLEVMRDLRQQINEERRIVGQSTAAISTVLESGARTIFNQIARPLMAFLEVFTGHFPNCGIPDHFRDHGHCHDCPLFPNAHLGRLVGPAK